MGKTSEAGSQTIRTMHNDDEPAKLEMINREHA
jgi:hypothetical protein